MSIESNVTDSERKLSIFVVSVTLLLTLMALWLAFFRQTNQDITLTNFAVLQKNFVEAVNLAHVEWMRQGRANNIWLYFERPEGAVSNMIVMSEAGWPQPHSLSAEGCARLWSQLLNQPTTSIQESLTVEFVPANDNSIMCQYSYLPHVNFTYHLASGVVSSAVN